LVVVTHHAPDPLCLPADHRTGWLAGNSASDLSPLTDSGRAALWVHGHIHDRFDLQRPGGIRILCNPAGSHFSNSEFRQNWVVTV
jgi:Icc-related predicted phosphoesterase